METFDECPLCGETDINYLNHKKHLYGHCIMEFEDELGDSYTLPNGDVITIGDWVQVIGEPEYKYKVGIDYEEWIIKHYSNNPAKYSLKEHEHELEKIK